ncbi:hypothetical protein IV88_GL000616 [Pediococcus argentinicus]|uniref:DNA-damage-inducible protein J n=2 Tax=Pediococcus argentinicus TaxID=480391 RepID=A0A0R2NLD4_9LACO|nr:hypothetical protein IV88_GL000616 [Pediococcus argentinicus]
MEIDVKEKEQLEKLYADLGMDLNMAVRLFFEESLSKNSIPLNINLKQVLNNQARNEALSPNLKSFRSADELMNELEH